MQPHHNDPNVDPNLRVHKVPGVNLNRPDISHYCKDCGALWYRIAPGEILGIDEEMWSVRSDFGDCCDKGAMDVQMRPLPAKPAPSRPKMIR